MSRLHKSIFLVVTVCLFGCSQSPEEKLKELSDSLCKEGIHNVYGAEKGLGVSQLQKAALLGSRKAQLEYGVLYANGEGVIKGRVEAYAWLSIVANDGAINAYDDLSGGRQIESDRDLDRVGYYIQARLTESGMADKLQAEGALEEVARRLNADSVKRAKTRANAIRSEIVNEVQKTLRELEAGK